MKICIISKNVYPVAANNGVNFAGGAEMQLLTLAKKFTDLGNTVEFVTDDFGQADIDEIKGIKYVKIPFRYMGGSKLYILSDWLTLYRKLKEIDADVYLLKGPRFNVFIMGVFVFFSKKPVIFVSSTALDSNPHILMKVDPFYQRWLYLAGIRLIPYTVCQSVRQQDEFKKYYDKKTTFIRNACADYHVRLNQYNKDRHMLWVGTNSRVKRPHLFLEFARRTPEIKYKMAMVPSENAMIQKKLENEISKVSNIEYHGFVQESKIEKVYAEASVLVNFSEHEGFPNVFLHAWAHKTPVVSLEVNPDGIIDKYRMGFCSGSMEQMIKDVRLLLWYDAMREEMGHNGYEYVKREHDSDKIAEQYIRLFEEVK